MIKYYYFQNTESGRRLVVREGIETKPDEDGEIRGWWISQRTSMHSDKPISGAHLYDRIGQEIEAGKAYCGEEPPKPAGRVNQDFLHSANLGLILSRNIPLCKTCMEVLERCQDTE